MEKRCKLRYCTQCQQPNSFGTVFCSSCNSVQAFTHQGLVDSLTFQEIIPAEILMPHIGFPVETPAKFIYNDRFYKIKIQPFFHIFKNSPKCAVCKEEGVNFALFRRADKFLVDSTTKALHAVLMSRRNVAFSLDHIVPARGNRGLKPRTLAWKNDISNLQPMCVNCNTWKCDSSMEDVNEFITMYL